MSLDTKRTIRGLAHAALLFLLALSLAGCGDSNAAFVEEDAETRANRQEARLRVKAQPVTRSRLTGGGNVTGTVRAFHRALINAETQGRVLERIVEPGARVEKGGVLVELESSKLALELRRTEASLRSARTVLAHAKREQERGEQLAAQSAISEKRRDDLQLSLDRAQNDLALARVARDTARRNLSDAKIKAPFAGTVDSIEVGVGDFVAAGTPVATMVDLSRVRIFGGVTAREAARLSPETKAKVSFVDLGGRSFDATLKSIGRVADAADGTFEIELWMDNEESVMRDGLVARIELPNEGAEEQVLAPRAALLRRDGQPEVFVVVEEAGKRIARVRRIQTGRSDSEWIEVTQGIEAGDLVVYDGHFALTDGSTVELDAVPLAVDAE